MKKTLLMAAAALAAGVISSQAQPVYSQNIVGYANLNLTSGYNLVSIQFNVGSSNGASEVFPSIPDGTELFQWDTSHSTFIYNFYDTGGGATAPVDSWYMADYSTPTNAPILKPGSAVFLLLPSAATNSVVGSVVNAYTNNLVAGYNMVGSVLPVGGASTSALFNLNGVPDGTEIFQWDAAHSTYIYTFYDTGGGATAPEASWYMSDYSTPTNAPNLSIGQGRFFLTPSTYTWSQVLTNQ